MLKKYWPYLVIVILWFIFSFPFFIKGNVPYPSTYQVNFFAPWNAYSEFASPIKNNAMPDVIGQIYPWKYFTIQTYLSGQIPLWNPNSFSGTPHLANYQSAVLSPFNILFFMLPFVDAWSVLVLLQPLLAGVFMYLLASSLQRSKIASLISSVSFMFCGFITTWMGYATLGYAILFLPLAIYGIEKFSQTEKKRFLVLTSILVPISFFSGHFQISLYFLLAVITYAFIKYLTNKNLRQALLTISYIFLGLLMSMPQLLPSIELYLQSLRSNLFLKAEVIPLNYFATFLAPDFFGNPVTRNDWFGHYAEWNGYIGIIPFILAIYSLLNKKNKQVIYLFIISALALLLAFDTPLLSLLVFLKIPVLSTSAASRIIVIYSFIFSLLCAFGYDALIKDVKNHLFKKIVILLGAILAVYVFLWAVILIKFLPLDKSIIARQNLILPSLIFIAFILLSLSLIIFRKRKYIGIGFGFACLILVSFDMLRFATKWMPFDPKDLVFKNVKTSEELQKLSGYDRLLGNLGGESVIYYSLPSVEGYDAVYLNRYGEFVVYISDGMLKTPERSVVNFPKKGEFTSKAIDLLGIKYIVHKKADDHAIWAFPHWEYKEGSFSLIYEDSKYQIYQNNNVFPRAFLVNQYKIITDKDLILSTMFSDKFDLSKSIILEKEVNIQQSTEDPGLVRIIKYTPNKIYFSVDAKTDALLFLSDSYFSGWKVLIDGKSQKIYRADYTFRAAVIKEGKHAVEFIYDPVSFKYGLILFLVGGLGLILVSLPKSKFFKG